MMTVGEAQDGLSGEVTSCGDRNLEGEILPRGAPPPLPHGPHPSFPCAGRESCSLERDMKAQRCAGDFPRSQSRSGTKVGVKEPLTALGAGSISRAVEKGGGKRSRKAVIPTALQVWVGGPGAAGLSFTHPHTRGGLRWPVRAPQPCAMELVLPWEQEPIRGLAETMHGGLVREVWGPVFPGHLSCHLEGAVHRGEPIQRGQSSQVRVRLRDTGRPETKSLAGPWIQPCLKQMLHGISW